MAGEKLELIKMKADSFGKIKTFTQMTGISCLIASPMFGSFFFDFSILVLLVSVILSYISLSFFPSFILFLIKIRKSFARGALDSSMD